MQEIDLELSEKGVTRFAAGDFYEHVFTTLSERQWQEIEEWTVNWAHHDRMTNLDIMSEGTERDAVTNRMKDYTYMLAHNIWRFRTREVNGRFQRELRIEKMEGQSHPLDWLPFEIGRKGIVVVA
jgi:KaiC/GvpD/RAD55 family RecA-like ATPase